MFLIVLFIQKDLNVHALTKASNQRREYPLANFVFRFTVLFGEHLKSDSRDGKINRVKLSYLRVRRLSVLLLGTLKTFGKYLSNK